MKMIRLAILTALFIPFFAYVPETHSNEYPTEGLVFHWKLDETSGTMAPDSSGNFRDGFLLGFNPFDDSYWIEGHIDGALWFEPGLSGDVASDMRVALGGLPPMTSTTWSLWVRIDEEPNVNGAFISADIAGSNNNGHNFGFHTGGTLRHPRILWNHNVGTTILLSPEPVDTGWNHMALTYDAPSTTLRMYVNGALKAESTTAAGTPFDLITLGRRGHGRFPFRGGVDEVLVYNRAVTAAEVAALAGLAVGGPVEILVGPASLAVWEGEDAVFSVEAVGTEPIEYQWYFNGDIIVGATEPSFLISAATLGDGGIYHVVVSNQVGGEVPSGEARLVVRPIRDDVPADIPEWIPADGLVAYWNLDDTSSFVTWDLSGNQHHGGLVGVPFDGSQEVDGMIGNALKLNPPSVDAAVVIQNLPEMTSTTWAAWVRILTPGAGTGPLANPAVISATFDGVGQAGQGHSLGFSSGVNNRNPRILWNHGVSFTSIISTEPLDDEWNHIALTFDVDSTTLILYVNGEQKGISETATTTPFSSLNLGRREASRQQPFGGLIDDVVVFDRALSAGEMLELYEKSLDQIAPPSGFATWRITHFSPEQLEDEAISGPLGDAVGDGVPNLIKYALGLNPNNHSRGALPNAMVDGEFILFSFARPVGLSDIEYAIEQSMELELWEDATAELIETVDHGNGTETVIYQVAIAETGRQFVRLRVRFL